MTGPCVAKNMAEINRFYHECKRTGAPYVFAHIRTKKYAKVEMDLIAQSYAIRPDASAQIADLLHERNAKKTQLVPWHVPYRHPLTFAVAGWIRAEEAAEVAQRIYDLASDPANQISREEARNL